MTALACFFVAACGLLYGWATDDGPLLILGFWLVLIGFGVLLAHDWRDYRRIAHEPIQGQLRIGLALYDPEEQDAA